MEMIENELFLSRVSWCLLYRFRIACGVCKYAIVKANHLAVRFEKLDTNFLIQEIMLYSV